MINFCIHNVTYFHFQDVCSNLWCRIDNRCSTHLEAAAEGTICGTNKVTVQPPSTAIFEKAEKWLLKKDGCHWEIEYILW